MAPVADALSQVSRKEIGSTAEPMTTPMKSEHAHEDTEYADDDARHVQDLLARRIWVEVLAVHVVRDEGGDSDAFGRAGRSDSHEKHNNDKIGASLAHQNRGGSGRHEAGGGVVRGQLGIERGGGETERRGEREGDGEPNEPAEEVAFVRRGR
eukprot:6195791-Pleurochrysis_carterae.AAC.1